MAAAKEIAAAMAADVLPWRVGVRQRQLAERERSARIALALPLGRSPARAATFPRMAINLPKVSNVSEVADFGGRWRY